MEFIVGNCNIKQPRALLYFHRILFFSLFYCCCVTTTYSPTNSSTFCCSSGTADSKRHSLCCWTLSITGNGESYQLPVTGNPSCYVVWCFPLINISPEKFVSKNIIVTKHRCKTRETASCQFRPTVSHQSSNQTTWVLEPAVKLPDSYFLWPLGCLTVITTAPVNAGYVCHWKRTTIKGHVQSRTFRPQ